MNGVFQEKSVRALLKLGVARLRDAQVPSYTLAAELLLLHVLGRDRTWMYAHPEEEISLANVERYSALIGRRAAGEPTQHLTGKQEFWGLEFEVTPDVLIPRPETEHVIEVALDRLAVREIRAGRRQPLGGEGLQIADVGTGSGCIAIALAKALPRAIFFALDVSAAALEVARRNAERHGVSDRMLFFQSDLFGDLVLPAPFAPSAPSYASATAILPSETLPKGDPPSSGAPPPSSQHSPFHFDVIVSNPPYVGRREAATLMREVREHEPEVALYGGEEGYELYADLIAQSAKCLLPRGILVLELGHNSLPAVRPLLDAPAWSGVSVTNDLAGIPRVLAAERLS
jgi:release factor glutamine methyltransferase